MIYKVFAVYDSKVKAYMQPFFMQTEGQAIRSWVDAVNDQSTQFYKHPEDFTLFLISEYDEESGKFKNCGTPEAKGLALELIRPKEEYVRPEVGKVLGAHPEVV